VNRIKGQDEEIKKGFFTDFDFVNHDKERLKSKFGTKSEKDTLYNERFLTKGFFVQELLLSRNIE
jgi:hypothetical protein